jgi:hypothetical protein
MRPDDITLEWLEARCKHDGECLVWDCMCHRGQPRARFSLPNGKRSTVNVRSLVWRVIGKRRLRKGEVVAMDVCNNQQCLNLAHMRKVTRTEILRRNNSDAGVRARKLAAITNRIRAQRAKLTIEQIRYIRASDRTLTDLSQELGVSFQWLSRIRRGEAWPDLGVSAFAGLGART